MCVIVRVGVGVRARARARAGVRMVGHTSESAMASHSLMNATRRGALPCTSPFRSRLSRRTPSLYAAPIAPPEIPSSANQPMSAREKEKWLSSGRPMTKSPWPRPPNSMKKVPDAATTTAHTKERHVIDADQCEHTSSKE